MIEPEHEGLSVREQCELLARRLNATGMSLEQVAVIVDMPLAELTDLLGE